MAHGHIKKSAVVFVDVIIPVHNAAATIRESVFSALKQEVPKATKFRGRHLHILDGISFDIAVCCYDDGSTDDSFKILQEMKISLEEKVCTQIESVRSKLLISRNDDGISRGAGVARNRAVSLRKHTEGIIENNHFLCLLDSDDIMHKHRVAEQVSVLLNLRRDEMHETLLGSTFNRIPAESTWHYTHWANNLTDERLILERFREVTILQPTWMLTRKRFDFLGGYIEAPTRRTEEDKIQVKAQENENPSSYQYKLIHPVYDTTETLRLAEDLRFFHAHLGCGKEQECRQDGKDETCSSSGVNGKLKLHRTEEPLVTYRHRAGQSQSSSTPRKLLLQLRAKSFEDTILRCDKRWMYDDKKRKGGFVIWGAGRDGKDFFKSLSPEIRCHVRCFVDVDEKKIKSGYYTCPSTSSKEKQCTKTDKMTRTPIVHFSMLAANDTVREEMIEKWINGDHASNNHDEINGRISKKRPRSINHERKATSAEKAPQVSKRNKENQRPTHNISKRDASNLVMLEELKELPVVVCVAMYRTNGVLERNVKNIGRTEGVNLWHFS